MVQFKGKFQASAAFESSFYEDLTMSMQVEVKKVNHGSLFFFLEDLFSVGDTLVFRRRDLGFLFEAGSNGTGNSLWAISEEGTDCHVCFLRVFRGV